ncbi:hypothetical protein QNO07_05895 [Streptomyces sp. 549]|uniref:hypothetical protein n=1 Tax=Streptomyces sp. 549 TaxID=3049076 RepID=UPI0024C40637|nr:hypothetical protein [Streptomyces sp. 549]MDK1472965.1 hypothetical protein [Streptomyces sp. 549]
MLTNEDRKTHREDEGPLSSQAYGILLSAHAPESQPWDAAFGGHQLCTTDGSAIEIENFRLKTEVNPLKKELRLRTLRPSDLRPGWEDEDSNMYNVKYSSVGRLPDTQDGRLPGTITQAKPGLKITQNCDQVEIENGYTELFVQFKVGKRGAYMNNMWIDYRANGKPYTLDLEWGAIACGDDIPLIDGQDYCEEEEDG